MNQGRGAKGPMRDWLDRSPKPLNFQKTKPIAAVNPTQSSFPNANKTNHQPARSSAKPAVASQNTNQINSQRVIHVPTVSGVKGNIASDNSVQININLQKNYYQRNFHKNPAPVGHVNNAPKANVTRKYHYHAPTKSTVSNNVASQNSMQINVNASSNVKSVGPRSNNVQHVNNSAKLQTATGTHHKPAHQNRSNNSQDGIQGTRFKRIIQGNIIDIEAAPYMLSMRLNEKHICGAAIIGEEWSLTAAHCCIKIVDNGTDSLYAYSGSSNLYEGGKLHKITQVVRHEKYLADIDDDYDICAVQVNPPFEYSLLTKAVKLPNASVPYDDSRGSVSGWGYTEADGKVVSPVLKSLYVKRVALERCKFMYKNLYTIHDRDVCYKAENNLGDACEGDSGGPLVNDDFILLGIVSFGDECGYSTLPGVYTDTIQFRNWIKNKTNI